MGHPPEELRPMPETANALVERTRRVLRERTCHRVPCHEGASFAARIVRDQVDRRSRRRPPASCLPRRGTPGRFAVLSQQLAAAGLVAGEACAGTMACSADCAVGVRDQNEGSLKAGRFHGAARQGGNRNVNRVTSTPVF